MVMFQCSRSPCEPIPCCFFCIVTHLPFWEQSHVHVHMYSKRLRLYEQISSQRKKRSFHNSEPLRHTIRHARVQSPIKPKLFLIQKIYLQHHLTLFLLRTAYHSYHHKKNKIYYRNSPSTFMLDTLYMHTLYPLKTPFPNVSVLAPPPPTVVPHSYNWRSDSSSSWANSKFSFCNSNVLDWLPSACSEEETRK